MMRRPGHTSSVRAADADADASSVPTTTTAAREPLVSMPPLYYAHGVLHAVNTKDVVSSTRRCTLC